LKPTYPEDGSDRYLRNNSAYPLNYKVSQLRRQRSKRQAWLKAGCDDNEPATGSDTGYKNLEKM
jgi:hypothetical protein